MSAKRKHDLQDKHAEPGDVPDEKHMFGTSPWVAHSNKALFDARQAAGTFEAARRAESSLRQAAQAAKDYAKQKARQASTAREVAEQAEIEAEQAEQRAESAAFKVNEAKDNLKRANDRADAASTLAHFEWSDETSWVAVGDFYPDNGLNHHDTERVLFSKLDKPCAATDQCRSLLVVSEKAPVCIGQAGVYDLEKLPDRWEWCSAVVEHRDWQQMAPQYKESLYLLLIPLMLAGRRMNQLDNFDAMKPLIAAALARTNWLFVLQGSSRDMAVRIVFDAIQRAKDDEAIRAKLVRLQAKLAK